MCCIMGIEPTGAVGDRTSGPPASGAARTWDFVIVDGHGNHNADADRTELKNLAAENPEKAKELAAKHDAWAARVGVAPWDEVTKRK